MHWDDCRVKFLRVQRRVFRAPSRELTKAEYYRLVETAQNSGRERLALLMETICRKEAGPKPCLVLHLLCFIRKTPKTQNLCELIHREERAIPQITQSEYHDRVLQYVSIVLMLSMGC